MQILGILNTLLDLFGILLLVYVVLSWLRLPANRWTTLLSRIVEPVLEPVRRLLRRILPPQAQIMDWSPLAVWLLLRIAQRVLLGIALGMIR